VIRCALLGPLLLTVDGDEPPAALLWRKHAALLVYLTQSPAGRSREQLIGLLWADRPEADARGSLNEALRHIRKAAGDALDTSIARVRLDPSAVELDVSQFLECERAGRWDAAAALVRGEFCEGFTVPDASAFDEWLSTQRTAWRSRSVEALVRATDSACDAGRPDLALRSAERAAALDPYADAAIRAVMRAAVLAGNRGVALAAFDQFAATLNRDLGTTPAPETAALAGQVRAERKAPRAEEPAPAPAPERVPLLDRAAELQGLLALAAGASGVGIVRGDSGSGKSRLLDEAIARLRLRGHATGTVRALPADAAAPFATLLALARGLADVPGAGGAAPAALAAIADRIPEWQDRFPAARGQAPMPLPEAVGELVRALTHEQPLVLAVDDAEWSDDESVNALAAATRAGPARLVVLLAVGGGRAHASIDLIESRIGRDMTGNILRLSPLSRPALEELADWAVPGMTGDDRSRLVRRVAHDSAGIPLLAVALLHAVRGGLELGDPSPWPAPLRTLDQTLPGDLPDSISAAIRVRFRRLEPAVQQVLAAASVLPAPTSSGALAAALGLAPADVDRALDILEWERWLESDTRGYSFVGRIVRDIVARDMLTPGQRRRLTGS
jgi:DNA-binding SARP family transcriptional activator